MNEPIVGTCTASEEPDLWFPNTILDDSHLWEPPREICATCPARNACLEKALTNREEYGMWGGTTPHERRLMLRRRYYRETAGRS